MKLQEGQGGSQEGQRREAHRRDRGGSQEGQPEVLTGNMERHR